MAGINILVGEEEVWLQEGAAKAHAKPLDRAMMSKQQKDLFEKTRTIGQILVKNDSDLAAVTLIRLGSAQSVSLCLQMNDAGRHWETEREAFLHPISRWCMWPYVGGPARSECPECSNVA
ncbi:hypothetical protein TNCV_288301 [Trichonephila clavipes]|nr:hypothetical protein TNCV_288301 [Trichonephila clavipes]